MDPDTCIWKTFNLPKGDYDLFGNISKNRYKYPYVRGGCIGLTRIAAQKILDSGMLLEDKYKNYNYQRYNWYKWPHEIKSTEEIAFQDWIMADVCHELKLKLKQWNDICILGNDKRVPDKADFAITHPNPIL